VLPEQIILYGFLASLATGMMTTVGAIPALFIKKISEKFEDTTLGFAAGVMLGASFFSLIVPGLDYADELWMNKYLSVLAVLGGLLIGVLSIWSVERYSPHEHFVIKKQYDDRPCCSIRTINNWLYKNECFLNCWGNRFV
jgi:ZIP family zinc transporter